MAFGLSSLRVGLLAGAIEFLSGLDIDLNRDACWDLSLRVTGFVGSSALRAFGGCLGTKRR